MHEKKSPSLSLQAFIEYIAGWLRNISRKRSPRTSKKTSLSNVNKIEQIAKILREKVHKRRKQKKPRKK